MRRESNPWVQGTFKAIRCVPLNPWRPDLLELMIPFIPLCETSHAPNARDIAFIYLIMLGSHLRGNYLLLLLENGLPNTGKVANSSSSQIGFKAKAKALSDLFRSELPITAGTCILAGEILALEGFPSAFIGLMGSLAGFLSQAQP